MLRHHDSTVHTLTADREQALAGTRAAYRTAREQFDASELRAEQMVTAATHTEEWRALLSMTENAAYDQHEKIPQ